MTSFWRHLIKPTRAVASRGQATPRGGFSFTAGRPGPYGQGQRKPYPPTPLAVVCLAGLALVDAMGRADAKHHREQAKPSADTEVIPKGPFEIIISIADQHLSLYGSGGLIARAPVSTGMRGHATPLGVFSVIEKQKWHRSNIYSAAPMPYMQRITWSGVALHAGILPGFPASHGCIRLSNAFATRLFHLTKVGTRVIITRRDVAPIDIDTPAFLMPAQKTAEPLVNEDPGRRLGAPPEVKTAAAADVAASASDGGSLQGPGDAGEQGGQARPISVFVSRKTQNLSVRQNFAPLFDSPIRIDQPESPIGTHIFTAMATARTAMRWTLVSIPEDARSEPRKEERKSALQAGAKSAEGPGKAVEQVDAVLGRVHIPSNVYDRIAALLTPGSSLIISDDAVSNETGSDTDFIVLTH
jgi:lipoprotein-anchoring transpeptidase ErfK/SrfK